VLIGEIDLSDLTRFGDDLDHQAPRAALALGITGSSLADIELVILTTVIEIWQDRWPVLENAVASRQPDAETVLGGDDGLPNVARQRVRVDHEHLLFLFCHDSISDSDYGDGISVNGRHLTF